jgi:hypothetical protein
MPASEEKMEGTCSFCNGTFSKKGIKKHLDSCGERNKHLSQLGERKSSAEATIMHFLVEGSWNPQYWMHIEMPGAAKLGELDQFLRDTWVECCGHMSAFTIEGEEPSMSSPLYKVVSRKSFRYEYDFGSTTELKLKLLAQRKGKIGNPRISILARNIEPFIPCGNCGKKATHVCSECRYDREGWLCDSCAAKHACGEEMLLPVVNSPRVGECGYTG